MYLNSHILTSIVCIILKCSQFDKWKWYIFHCFYYFKTFPQLLVWSLKLLVIHFSVLISSLFISKEVSASYSVMSNSLWPMDYSLSGFSVHGILQARILAWVAIPFSRRSFPPRDQTWVSCIAGRFYIYPIFFFSVRVGTLYLPFVYFMCS